MNPPITDGKIPPEGTSLPPRTGLTPDVLPEVQTPSPAENSPTGVPTNYTQSARHWYALRATYGQESKANDYLVSQGVKTYVYDNVNLPYLRFYCRRVGIGGDFKYEPLIVPDYQLENLRKVLADQSGGLVIVPDDEHKFDKGATVRVTGGTFKGVVGKVARYCGHQRVAIVVDGLLTIATTYIPSAYLEKID